MMTIEEINAWVSTAKKGEETVYYKGFFAEEAFRSFEMRKFSKDLLDFEKKLAYLFCIKKKLKQVINLNNPFMNIA
jgi:hypothetical protein